MMTVTQVKPADLLFVSGEAWMSKGIKWMTRQRGESKTYANHTAGGVSGVRVVEALWTVKSSDWDVWQANNAHWRQYRHTGLNDVQRLNISVSASQYIGRKYGALKIFAHAGDCLLGKVFGKDLFWIRRICFLDSYPICSWLWGWAYEKEGMSLGTSARAGNPDSQEDHCKADPLWELVQEI